MTILRPRENKKSRLVFIASLSLIILAFGAVYIYAYNTLAELRYEYQSLTKAVAAGQSANADLRNQLYELEQSFRVEMEAEKARLVLEKNPAYLNLKNN